MDTPEISVYGEAKGEYTRQLCVFLIPSLETYFLNLLNEAKTQSPSPQKNLWSFQTLLQAIPDWNQDKVVRETELIQKDCKCDYLEELLTAVFIAHTKVLSAIRLSTKQKKLQITIPKLDHFLHRVLSECARSLWVNTFLFAETNSIEKQKNLRQVSGLIQDSIQQAIRGLLPVKSILREYLHDDDEEVDDIPDVSNNENSAALDVSGEVTAEAESAPQALESVAAPEAAPESAPEAAPEAAPEVAPEVAPEAAPEVAPEVASEAAPEVAAPEAAPAPESLVAAAPESASAPVPAPAPAPVLESAPAAVGQPTIYIDTKPSVSFSQENVIFDSYDSLEANEIYDIPFTEDGDTADITNVEITNELLPIDVDELD